MINLFRRRQTPASYLAALIQSPMAIDAGPLAAHIAEVQSLVGMPAGEVEQQRPYQIDNRTAVIDCAGPVAPRVPTWAAFWGVPILGLAELSSAIKTAQQDPEVDNIQLAIDSPGGSIVSLEDTALAIKGSIKPIQAYVYGQCCSAAYWLASACAGISAASGSTIGSIGTIISTIDMSGMYQQAGLTVEVFASGPLKGMGTPGTSLSETQRAHIQSMVDATAQRFFSAVREYRQSNLRNPDETGAFSGAAWTAEMALEMGLIDRLTTPATAPIEAVKEVDMNQDNETAQLREELAKTKAALAEVERASALAARVAMIDAAIANGRMVPAMRESAIQLAASVTDVSALASFIGAMPVFDGAARGRSVPEQSTESSAREKLDSIATKIAADLRISKGSAVLIAYKQHPDLYAAAREEAE
jgi:signal peptide peptidase SppA